MPALVGCYEEKFHLVVFSTFIYLSCCVLPCRIQAPLLPPVCFSVISRLSLAYLPSIFHLSSVSVPYLTIHFLLCFKTWYYQVKPDGFYEGLAIATSLLRETTCACATLWRDCLLQWHSRGHRG